MCLFAFWLFLLRSDANAADGDTYLSGASCRWAAANVETPYDIDFGDYSADEVTGKTITNTGTVKTGDAITHVSSTPSINTSWLYLVVTDVCGDVDWHADLLASAMHDTNYSNNYTGADIPAANLKLQNNWTEYFLDNTPSTPEIVASTIGTDFSFDAALQLLSRTVEGEYIGGKYGVTPTYKLIIPIHQHVDRYQGTITWTVI